MLSKRDFIICMKIIRKNEKEIEKFVEDIGKYFDSVYIFDLGNNAIINQIEIVKIAMEENVDNSWIDWYIYENDWGNNKLTAGYENNINPVKNSSHLYQLILESKKK